MFCVFNFTESVCVSGSGEWTAVQEAVAVAGVRWQVWSGGNTPALHRLFAHVLLEKGGQQSSELPHSWTRQQEVQRRVPAWGQTHQQNRRQGRHLPQQGHRRLSAHTGPRRGECHVRWRQSGRQLMPHSVYGRSCWVNMRGHNIDKLKCIIRQPANCENQRWTNQQSGSLLVAPVGGQSATAAVEVRDDEATVDGDTEERGHVIEQERRDQEEQPLVSAHWPRATLIEVNVGDLG